MGKESRNMKKVIDFLKKDTVLSAAAILAVVSMCLVPPDSRYLEYIDFSVIAVLFCLMGVVAGFRRCSLFDFLSARLLSVSRNAKTIFLMLVLCCFFSAMFITNDVALITFIPLTLILFKNIAGRKLVYIIVLETAAANVGSSLTPIGNPQNLYLYSFYHMDAGQFFSAVAPLCLFGLILILLMVLCFRSEVLEAEYTAVHAVIDKKRLCVFAALFLLCVLTVLHVLDYRVCLIVTVAVILIVDKTVFGKIDYALLGTFAAFFILVGNLGRIGVIERFISGIVSGREMLVGVLVSQVISNVPASIMLSHFTDQAVPLLVGVNLGGLGTIVASLASLISYKFYAKSEHADKPLFFKVFTLVNFGSLVLLYLVLKLIGY